MEPHIHNENFTYTFMPHGHCYLWDPGILWLQIISNGLIAIAYFLIPFALVYFIRKRKDIVFRWVFILFGIFIVSCGITHILDIIIIWKPLYWLDSIIRVITAIASISTAIALVPLIPKAINLPSPEHLRKEIKERQLVEQELKKAHLELESKVEERTLELMKANELLKQEISERNKFEIALKASEEQFRFLADNMPQIVWTAKPNGELDYYNEKWFDYTGMSLEQPHGWDPILHPDDLEITLNKWKNSYQNLKPYEIEHRIKRYSDEQYRWHLARAIPFVDKHNQVIKWFGTSTDIHHHKLDEELLKSQKEELERFTYINSHDLQEPLRSITSFTQILKRRYNNIFDDEANEFMNIIINSTFLMKDQINSFMDYLKLSENNIKYQKVDFNNLMEFVITDLELFKEKDNAIISYDSLPVIQADYSMMIQVFTNLIINSLKFKKDKPIINIKAEKILNEWLFSVSDNGIGIEPEFFDRVFIVFQRLNDRGNYKGTGIGLTICKKIIEIHNGKIWIESNLDQGVTIKFTLPEL